MKPHLLPLAAALLVTLLAGCASEGGSKAGTGTSVNLSGNNYRVIRPGVSGSSCGFSLLGFIPLFPPSYADAKSSLLNHAGVAMKGRSVAIANQTEDRSSLYLIAFSIPRITLTGDIVEFTGSPELPVNAAPAAQ
jgi:hypothetical protein